MDLAPARAIPDHFAGFSGMLCDLVRWVSKTVYKGRKKKTIEYFAVKSVDKSQRSKVLSEVSALLPCVNRGPHDRAGWYSGSPGVGSLSFARGLDVAF
jgi:hypothetical protein